MRITTLIGWILISSWLVVAAAHAQTRAVTPVLPVAPSAPARPTVPFKLPSHQPGVTTPSLPALPDLMPVTRTPAPAMPQLAAQPAAEPIAAVAAPVASTLDAIDWDAVLTGVSRRGDEGADAPVEVAPSPRPLPPAAAVLRPVMPSHTFDSVLPNLDGLFENSRPRQPLFAQ